MFEDIGIKKDGVWLDDGDCIICSICNKALDARYVERKGDCIRVPFRCPSCNSHMSDVKKA